MVSFPNAKVNLGLYITQKRDDGFHNIETVFLPVNKLCDILEIVPLSNKSSDVAFTQSGIIVDGDISDNLCVKAYNLLKEHVKLPSVAIHLHKQIPMGAGLGGGSANGAFTLKMLNQLIDNPLPNNELAELALILGSDCPFFLLNSPCFAGGRGEKIEPISLNLSGYSIVLVNPGIHVNTGKAYAMSAPQPAPFNLRQIETISIEKWKDLATNDFEKVVFPQHPQIEDIKNELYALGAIYASMSGSGSTVFGIFKQNPVLSVKLKSYFTHYSSF
jgi:4-diphosphocytidyl-2-C-methyl-D-erythritol kinase